MAGSSFAESSKAAGKRPQQNTSHETESVRAARSRRPQHSSLREPASSQASLLSQNLSLAGPRSPNYDPHNTFVEEGYREENPWMDKEDAEVSLAKNFPRKLRFTPKHRQDISDVTELQTVPSANETEPERDTQVASAEAQAHESIRSSSQATTEVDGHDFGAQQVHDDQPFARKAIHAYRPGDRGDLTSIADRTPKVDPDPNLRPHNRWGKARRFMARPLGEFLGTLLFMFIGISANLSMLVADPQPSPSTTYWAWGFAVMLGIYVAGGASGAFLNPAITIMLSIFRGFPMKRIITYISAQLLGAWLGTLLAIMTHYDAIKHFDPGPLSPKTTGIYLYTQPKSWVKPHAAFFTEFLGSAVIGCCILALGDSGNSPPGAGMHAFIIGLLVVTCTMACSEITGAALNGVRDLGARLAALTVGYRPLTSFLTGNSWWIWGPWGATILGALFGAFVYDLCIFKGAESPVNYGMNRWKVEGWKAKSDVFHWFGFEDRANNASRRAEEGKALKRT